MVSSTFLKQVNYCINLCKVKSKYFSWSLLGTDMCSNIKIRWSFACSQWAGSTYIQTQDGQRIAVMGMFAISGQSSEFSVVSDLFHAFNSPKG